MSGSYSRIAGLVVRCAMIFMLATATTGCRWLRFHHQPEQVQHELQSTNPAPNLEEHSPEKRYMYIPEMKTIYFSYDRSAIRPDQIDAMESDLKYLRDNLQTNIFITGHADERGSTEYNFSLGMKRAAAVKEYFTSHGIDAKRIEVGSKGKEQPAVVGKGEAAYAKNRRAEFQCMY